MKIIYIISFSLAIICSACNDWLNVDPKDKVLEEKQYSSESNINSALNGLYRQMVAENLYGGQLSQTTIEMMAHYYFYPKERPNTDIPIIISYELANHNYTWGGNKDRFADIWKSAYELLLHINVYIKGVNESPAIISQEHKDLLLGEAYALRAYLHFDLYRLFCPYNAEATDKVLPYNRRPDITLNHSDYENIEYSTSGEYFAFLEEDIRIAKDLLKNDPILNPDSKSITDNLADDFYKNRNRRMNYYALKGLEARVLQYSGKDTEAAQAAKEITDAVGTEGTLFRWVDPNKVTTEHNYIFFSEVVFGINNIDMASRAKNYYLGTNILTAYIVDDNNLMKNILAYDNLLESFPDVRARQWTFTNITSWVGYAADGAKVSNKYKTESSQIKAIKDLQVLMRISEMYYIQAEAALNTGWKADAIYFLNQVLQHRGLSAQYFVTESMSEETIRDHIKREYYREFFGEGQVFFYHKRLKSPTMYKGNAEGSDDITPDKSYVIPIPDIETNI
ncbi:MAG: RagB/SusD family nutrient uptake outer membrane protein [Prevotella sp.]|jgi:hypothetical protein|nr:RagB/SusD family nutrient uptake outer membrane protein [Prevotella sp.]MDR2005272.1 RagB/SusD family nutrient uptake outer membrane protein [Prevotella sp.]